MIMTGLYWPGLDVRLLLKESGSSRRYHFEEEEEETSSFLRFKTISLLFAESVDGNQNDK